MIERTRSIDIAARIILIVGVAFILAPLVIAFLTATLSYEQFVRNGGITLQVGTHFLDNLAYIWTETALPAQLWNSIVISTLVAAIKCAFAFTATFALVFFDNRLNRIVFGLTLVTVMLPLELVVITTYQIVANIAMPLNWILALTGLGEITGLGSDLRLSLLDTYVGVAAPIACASTSVFIYRQFFLSLPRDLPKAAAMDGAGPWRFMWDILLPLSWTPLVATFMFWFIGGWTQYLWPLVAASTPDAQPAVVGLARLATTEQDRIPEVPMLMTGALFVSFIPVLLIAVMQRQIVRGLNLSEK
ncbi:MAG: sn-glycerol 3-phosphate transport system permease protein [Rhodobacteraceae bacterium HLUCCA08]|nr:MAG: sn-glycerol 3-phosphate transport system permease protein [Rhodobacteraceae bacterium HLUCCA08]